MKAHFPFDGRCPERAFYVTPQFNTWVELRYDHNRQAVLDYAHSLLSNGYAPGVLMIDDTWQEDYGVWRFHPGRFPDPAGMVKELHEMGFAVMVWAVPVVSPDSAPFRKALNTPGALILLCARETASPYVAAKLNIEVDAPVFRLRRLRTADSIPLAIHDCWYPLKYCGSFLTETYHADSVYKLLEENGFELVHATQTVSAKNASRKEAEMLGIQDGSALLHVERVSYTASNIAMELSDMLYNPVRYDLHMELNR